MDINETATRGQAHEYPFDKLRVLTDAAEHLVAARHLSANGNGAHECNTKAVYFPMVQQSEMAAVDYPVAICHTVYHWLRTSPGERYGQVLISVTSFRHLLGGVWSNDDESLFRGELISRLSGGIEAAVNAAIWDDRQKAQQAAVDDVASKLLSEVDLGDGPRGMGLG